MVKQIWLYSICTTRLHIPYRFHHPPAGLSLAEAVALGHTRDTVFALCRHRIVVFSPFKLGVRIFKS